MLDEKLRFLANKFPGSGFFCLCHIEIFAKKEHASAKSAPPTTAAERRMFPSESTDSDDAD